MVFNKRHLVRHLLVYLFYRVSQLQSAGTSNRWDNDLVDCVLVSPVPLFLSLIRTWVTVSSTPMTSTLSRSDGVVSGYRSGLFPDNEFSLISDRPRNGHKLEKGITTPVTKQDLLICI